MKPASKLLEQIAFNTRPKIEEHFLVVMDKSTHEEPLAQPLQTNNKQFKIAVTFLNAYNGIFKVTNSNNKFHFKRTFIEEDFIQITILSGAYELESLNDEIKRIIIDKVHYPEAEYPFTMKPNFSTLGSIIEIDPQGAIIGSVFDDSIRNLPGFRETMLFKKHNLSDNPVDNLSVDKIFLECDIAKGMLFKGKRSNNNHNWTMTVVPEYKYVEKFAGGVTWYMMETKDVVSSISLKLENESNELVSFNGQSVTFILSIKEIFYIDQSILTFISN